MSLPLDLVKQFHDAGYMVALFNIDQLDPESREVLSTIATDIDDYRQLLLLGSAGTPLWKHVSKTVDQKDHPLDEYTIEAIDTLIGSGFAFKIVYPGNHMAPLMQLGAAAGWHHGSPLGIGIHGTFGLWFAYRAVVLMDSEIPITAPLEEPSPCITCEDQDCVAACPATAVSPDGFDLNSCTTFRLIETSPCADTCLARLACPVAREYRYDADQIAYHYGRSRDALSMYTRSMSDKDHG